ncbi:MAG: 50S ribosomal protein L23 [Patescibacteria group bacterium]
MEQGLVLKRPIISEKSLEAASKGEYTFEVDKNAKKKDIVQALKKVFGVDVKKVKTMVVKGKTRRALKTRREYRLGNWEKAIVKLKEGQKIDVFETGKEEEKK